MDNRAADESSMGYCMEALAIQRNVSEMNRLARQASSLAAQRKYRNIASMPSSLALDMGEKSHALSAVERPVKCVLFFGIIDILQEYNTVKQAENLYKGIVGKRSEISSVDPRFYASRFLAFMSGVFEKPGA